MREMKDSGIEWIGEIPTDWNIEKNKYILYEIYSGGTPTSGNPDFYSDEGMPFITISDMSNCEYVYETKSKLTKTGIANKKLKLLKAGTILYSIYATIGEVSESKIDSCINQAILALFPRYEKVHKQFYKYSLKAIKDYVMQNAMGTTQNNLNAEKVLNFIFPSPSLAEQSHIASFLDSKCSEIDSLHSDIEEEIETLKEYKKSVITEAVTKGLNPDTEMKDSGIERIGEIPSHWQIKRFKYAVESLSKGNGITKEDIKDDGNIQCIRYGEIYSKYSVSVLKTFSRTDEETISSPKHIKYGDILFSGTGELVEEIGKNIVYLGMDPCLAGGDIIIAKHNQEPRFLNYAANSVYMQNQKSFGKAKLKVVHISTTEIGNLLIAFPSLEEQERIADYLDSKCFEIDSIIESKQQQLETLEQYKKSLIYEYVTGKKEVPYNA